MAEDCTCYQISPEYFGKRLYQVISQISWQFPSCVQYPQPDNCVHKIINLCLQQGVITSKMGKKFAYSWQNQIRQGINNKVADALYQIIKLSGYDVNLSAATGHSLMTASVLSGEPKFIDMMIAFGYQDWYLVDGKASAINSAQQALIQLIEDKAKEQSLDNKDLINLRIRLLDYGLKYVDIKSKDINLFTRYIGLGIRVNLDSYKKSVLGTSAEILGEMQLHYQGRHTQALSRLKSEQIVISDDALDGLHGTLAKDIFELLFSSCKCQTLQPVL